MRRFVLLIAVIVVSLQSHAHAGERLTLADALQTALRDNPRVRAMGWAVKARAGEKGVALSHLLPTVAVEERFSRTDNPTYSFMAKLNQERFEASDFAIDSLNDPDPVNNYQTIFSFRQPVFAKKAIVGLDMAGEALRTAELELERLKEKIALDVTRAYVGVVSAREYLAVAERGLEDAREHVRIAQSRFDAGLGLYSDVLRARVAVYEAERAVVEARRGLDVARRQLGLLLGMDSPVDVAGYDVPAEMTVTIDEYLASAVKRTDVLAMESRYENARNAVRLAEAEYFPVIGMGGSYELDDHDSPFGSEGRSWQVMAFLKVNVFDGFRREKERSVALNRAKEALEYLEALRKQVAFEVHSAYLRVEETERKYSLAMASVKSAEEGVRLVEKRYQNSLAPIVSLLDAQVALDRARAEAVAMRGEHLVALAELEFASGRLLERISPRADGETVFPQVDMPE